MRLLLATFVCGVAASVVGQCPVEPLQASLNPSGKLVIRYLNSDTRLVRAVQFIVARQQVGQAQQLILSEYSLKANLRPKHDGTAMFEVGERNLDRREWALAEPLEVEVTRVSFAGLYTWMAPRNNPCRISISRR